MSAATPEQKPAPAHRVELLQHLDDLNRTLGMMGVIPIVLAENVGTMSNEQIQQIIAVTQDHIIVFARARKGSTA